MNNLNELSEGSDGNVYFVAIDGDDIGPQLRDFIINNDIEGAAKYSENLKTFFEDVEMWLRKMGAKIIFRGGDSVLAYNHFHSLEEFSNSIPAGICDVSIGLGSSAEFVYLALQLAKARGKGRIVELTNTDASTIRIISDRHMTRRRTEFKVDAPRIARSLDLNE